MFKLELINPINVSQYPTVKIKIESVEDIYEVEAINILGGIITHYEKGSPTTCVVPIGLGEVTPGMLLSHITCIITSAMALAVKSEIPEHIIREIAYLAVNEGLNSNQMILD